MNESKLQGCSEPYITSVRTLTIPGISYNAVRALSP